MNAQWLVIKYTPDLRRNEPRNVGIVAFVGDAVSCRLLGVDGDWRVDAHKAKAVVGSVPNYRAWVDHWRRLTEQAAPVDVWLEQRDVDNYRVVPGGSILTGEVPDDLASEMYDTLVAATSR